MLSASHDALLPQYQVTGNCEDQVSKLLICFNCLSFFFFIILVYKINDALLTK